MSKLTTSALHKVSFLQFITSETRKCFALLACRFLCIYTIRKAYNIELMGGTIDGRRPPDCIVFFIYPGR